MTTTMNGKDIRLASVLWLQKTQYTRFDTCACSYHKTMRHKWCTELKVKLTEIPSANELFCSNQFVVMISLFYACN